MVDWDQWQTLLAVFRYGTYAHAARSLRIDATTVGRRLKLLEKRFGEQLFFRKDGRLNPTNRCEALLSHIETASEALHAAEQETATSSGGTVWRCMRLTAAPYLIRNLFAPAIGDLTEVHRIRIELMGVVSNASLSRREADIAVRIDDQPPEMDVVAEQIGVLTYAVYCAPGADPATLPWAGLVEEYIRSPGGQAMVELAGPEGFQYRAYHFDPLGEFARSGVARTMLPRFAADREPGLTRVSDTVLEQPLWMLYHPQDRDVPHLSAARSWIRQLANDKLTTVTTDSAKRMTS